MSRRIVNDKGFPSATWIRQMLSSPCKISMRHICKSFAERSGGGIGVMFALRVNLVGPGTVTGKDGSVWSHSSSSTKLVLRLMFQIS